MKPIPENMLEIMREEMVMSDKIIDALKNGAETVPEVAEKLTRPVHHVMLWMMGMRRYGVIEERGRPDENGYFHYVVREKDA